MAGLLAVQHVALRVGPIGRRDRVHQVERRALRVGDHRDRADAASWRPASAPRRPCCSALAHARRRRRRGSRRASRARAPPSLHVLGHASARRRAAAVGALIIAVFVSRCGIAVPVGGHIPADHRAIEFARRRRDRGSSARTRSACRSCVPPQVQDRLERAEDHPPSVERHLGHRLEALVLVDRLVRRVGGRLVGPQRSTRRRSSRRLGRTALRKSVRLPSGTSLSQPSTISSAPWSIIAWSNHCAISR